MLWRVGVVAGGGGGKGRGLLERKIQVSSSGSVWAAAVYNRKAYLLLKHAFHAVDWFQVESQMFLSP